MSVTTKKPAYKQTVGAQFICFATNIDALLFEESIERSETVKQISTTENSETIKIYASGKIYDQQTDTPDVEISTEVIAFVISTLAKMKGHTVSPLGLVTDGEESRPYFAYGKIVELSGGVKRYEWFPKCQLTANTDDIATKEGSVSEQTDTLTITAVPFKGKQKKVYMQTDMEEFPKGLTADKFFSKVIVDDVTLQSVLTDTPEEDEEGV